MSPRMIISPKMIRGYREFFHQVIYCQLDLPVPDINDNPDEEHDLHDTYWYPIDIGNIQQGLGPDWRSFSEADIHLLGHLLQCTWNTIDQKVWEAILFGKASTRIIRKILSLGEEVSPGHNPGPETVAEIKKILLSLG